jgi:hypothetical protein
LRARGVAGVTAPLPPSLPPLPIPPRAAVPRRAIATASQSSDDEEEENEGQMRRVAAAGRRRRARVLIYDGWTEEVRILFVLQFCVSDNTATPLTVHISLVFAFHHSGPGYSIAF